MEKKDIITLIISSIALILSFTSFIITINQKKRENIRILRKNLSDTLNDLLAISIAMGKLIADTKNDFTNEIIELRRSYNTQRKALLIHADFLINENPELATDTDYNIMANNWNIVGNYPKAEQYWQMTIQKSDDLVIKHMNLRGYAIFLFFQGNMPSGRSKFNEALELRLPDTENVKKTISDTYVMWARIEKNFKFYSEAQRLLELAKNSCERISHMRIKNEVEKQIQLFESET